MLIGFLKFGIIDKKASAVLPKVYRKMVSLPSASGELIQQRTLPVNSKGCPDRQSGTFELWIFES